MVDEREDGFSLIELMTVVLIIAVLMAIAIPSYLGARERATDRAGGPDPDPAPLPSGPGNPAT